MAASTAIFVLLVFHVSVIVMGVLNWDSDCGEALWIYLVAYGAVGLLFIYLLFREWLYYARPSSLPTLFNLILLIIFYALLSTAGGFLTVRAPAPLFFFAPRALYPHLRSHAAPSPPFADTASGPAVPLGSTTR